VLTDDTLVVADGGEVKGNLNVGTLIITGGLVDATVRAKDAVEIHPGGHLKGEVFSPVMQIERGAIFEGQSHMTDPKNEDTPASAETLPELPDPPEPTGSDLGDLELDD
jgi:cytoskeletal protein CcmA (bactofilin family)